MKPLKPNTKYNLKNIFGSLINNDCAVAAAKTLPWWSSVLVFLLGISLPLIPIIVSVCNSYGASAISSTLYGFNRDLTAGCIELHNQKYEVKINDDKKAVFYKNNAEFHPAQNVENELVYSYTNTTEKIEGSTGQYEFDIFFTERGYEGDYSVNYLINYCNERQFILGTKTPKGANDPEGTAYYTPSYMIFHREGLVSVIYKHNSTTMASGTSFSGDWKHTASNQDIITRVLTCDGYEIPTSLNTCKDPVGYIDAVLNNWKEVYNEAYIESKSRALTYNSLIYFGIYAALVLFLGLLMFLLTRSKKNINRYLKWYQCLFISFWACLAPGILAMATGFFLSNYAIMLFVLFVGIRAMWLSMKQLSPTYQGK